MNVTGDRRRSSGEKINLILPILTFYGDTHLIKQCFWCLCVCINTMDQYLAYTVFQVADDVSI